MRLWSVDFKYLDTQGFVGLWREAILARRILSGESKAYYNHPEIIRFRRSKDSITSIEIYIKLMYIESLNRKYSFDLGKVKNKVDVKNYNSILLSISDSNRIPITEKEVIEEWNILKSKLEKRDPNKYLEISKIDIPNLVPIFKLIKE